MVAVHVAPPVVSHVARSSWRQRLGVRLAAVGWTRHEWMLVALATLVGAALRFAWQLDRPFMNDEVGTLGSLGKSYGQILTEWGTTQTQHYFLMLLRVMFDLSGAHAWGLVFIPFVCGVLTVPATGLVATALGEPRAGVFACLLAAMNPYLISRTGMIRAYPLQIFLSVVLIWLFALWWRRRSLQRGVAVAITTLLLALAHPNSVLLFASLAISGVLVEAARLVGAKHRSGDLRDLLRSWATLAVPMAIAAVATMLAYAPIFQSDEQPAWTEIQTEGRTVVGHSPIGVSFLDDIWPRYFADDYLAWPTTILFLVGAVLIIRRRTWMRAALLLLAVLGFVVSARGIDAPTPTEHTRWLAFALPALLLVMAFAAVELGGRSRRRFLPWITVGVLIASWQPNVISLFESKRLNPWNDVRTALGSTDSPPLVIGLGHTAFTNLGPENRSDYHVLTIRSPQAWETDEGLRTVTNERRIYMVHLGFDLRCEGPTTDKKGQIRITRFTASSAEDLRDRLFDCLFETATTYWSAAPVMLPVYDFLLAHGRSMGRNDYQRLFEELRDAAHAQTPGDWHMSLDRRQSRANRLEQRIRARH